MFPAVTGSTERVYLEGVLAAMCVCMRGLLLPAQRSLHVYSCMAATLLTF